MSGLTILVSQYWGKQDIEAINRCMGFAAYTGVCITALAALILFTFPTQVLSLVTNNSILIEMGAPYLKICLLYTSSARPTAISWASSTSTPKERWTRWTGCCLLYTSPAPVSFYGTARMFGDL